MPTRVPLLFGTGLFGFPDSPPEASVRVADKDKAQAMLNAFHAHGYNELDTARAYGRNEEYISSQLDLKQFVVDTKIDPARHGGHNPESLRKTIQESLDYFRPHNIKIRILYLHFPDRTVPYEETVAELDKMHKEGLFELFGLSNYTAWEVAEIYTLCKERGYVLPTVYQGNYNLLVRSMEPELVPCLRKFNIRFVAWNPLAGGFLAGKFKTQEDMPSAGEGGRFDPNTWLGGVWTEMYVKDANFKAVRLLKEAADKAGLTLVEVALRWLQHHSALTPQDGVLFGASSLEQLENNMRVSELGPLPDDILPVIEEAWQIVAPTAKQYYF